MNISLNSLKKKKNIFKSTAKFSFQSHSIFVTVVEGKRLFSFGKILVLTQSSKYLSKAWLMISFQISELQQSYNILSSAYPSYSSDKMSPNWCSCPQEEMKFTIDTDSVIHDRFRLKYLLINNTVNYHRHLTFSQALHFFPFYWEIIGTQSVQILGIYSIMVWFTEIVKWWPL